jgi:hypothetical protein
MAGIKRSHRDSISQPIAPDSAGGDDTTRPRRQGKILCLVRALVASFVGSNPARVQGVYGKLSNNVVKKFISICIVGVFVY